MAASSHLRRNLDTKDSHTNGNNSGGGGNRGGKLPRKRRRPNYVVLGLATIIGICYLFENIGYSSSINKEISKRYELREDSQSHDSDSSIAVGGGSAFCLLIKDDNDILSEWIAYHYHVFQMRRLIVAVDPDSKTSPLEVLEPWGIQTGNFDLHFTLWQDEDYTPEFFHARNYSNMPNSVGREVTLVDCDNKRKNADDINQPILKTIWHRNETYVREHQEEVRREVHQINNHRFRQKNFVSECFRQIQREQRDPPRASSWFLSRNNHKNEDISWAVHIDTDEFLVPNPWIASYVYNESDSSADKYFRRSDFAAMLPQKPSAGSLWSLYHQFLGHVSNNRTCVMMPRILFGAKEAEGEASSTNAPSGSNMNKTISWSHKNFESLRWQFHSDFESDARPKSIVDAAQLTENDAIFRTKLATSIHRPLPAKPHDGKPGCSAEPLRIQNSNRFGQPIAVYHYLGSLERYLARGDVRRDPRVHHRHNANANYARGDENHHPSSRDDRWWIGGWLDSFVETHGGAKVYTVLGERYAKLLEALPE